MKNRLLALHARIDRAIEFGSGGQAKLLRKYARALSQAPWMENSSTGRGQLIQTPAVISSSDRLFRREQAMLDRVAKVSSEFPSREMHQWVRARSQTTANGWAKNQSVKVGKIRPYIPPGYSLNARLAGLVEFGSALRRRISVVAGKTSDPSRVIRHLTLNGNVIGTIGVTPELGGDRIYSGWIKPEFRGMGLGKKLYGEALRRSPGGVLSSDHFVSKEAQRVYNSFAKSKSYSVNPLPKTFSNSRYQVLTKAPAPPPRSPEELATIKRVAERYHSRLDGIMDRWRARNIRIRARLAAENPGFLNARLAGLVEFAGVRTMPVISSSGSLRKHQVPFPIATLRLPKPDWSKIERTLVPLNQLRASQSTVTNRGVRKYLRGGRGNDPVVVRTPQGLVIADGHHRLAVSKLRGHKAAWVGVTDLLP